MHHWQDLVLTVGSIIFAVALIPSLLSSSKPAVGTSLLTGGVLLVFSAVYMTLLLRFSSISTALTGLLWLILAWQKYSQNRSSDVRVK